MDDGFNRTACYGDHVASLLSEDSRNLISFVEMVWSLFILQKAEAIEMFIIVKKYQHSL